MSGRDLATYDDAGDLDVSADTGPVVETGDDTREDMRQIVADLREDTRRGLAKGSTRAARQATGKGQTTYERRAGAPVQTSQKTKDNWASLPDHAREDFRRLGQAYNTVAEFAQPLLPYHNLCIKNGTTIERALAEVNQLENLMLQDPVAGFTAIARRMGLDPVSAAQAWLNSVMLNVPSPQQVYAQRSQDQAAQQLVNEVEAFGRSHPWFEILRPDMAQLIERGAASSLEDAYQLASLRNPDTRALAARQLAGAGVNPGRAAVVAAKAAAEAVSGAPSSRGSYEAPLPENDGSARSIARAAIARQRGQV